jgi:hypothetical protein
MGLLRTAGVFIAVCLGAAFIVPVTASAHGGVKLEQDECVFKIGPNTMHFVGYQRSGEEQEFCEDIAQTGPTVIGITAVSPDLRDMAIGVRVIKDVGAEQEKANIEGATVFSRPPKVYQNGSMTFEHDFKEPGRYVGIVTVSDDLGNSWVSRFPFRVGVFSVMGVLEYILYGVAFVALCGFLWFMLSQRAKKREESPAPLSAREA